MARSLELRSKRQATESSRTSAVARRRRTGDSSSADSFVSNEDAPYRNLRRRVSSQGRQDKGREPSAVKNRSSVKKQGRKRSVAAVGIPAAAKTHPQPKRSKTLSSLSVEPSHEESVTQASTKTRSQRPKLNHVTPSPTQNPSSPAFSFSSPVPKRKGARVFEYSSKVPKGVIDIYPSKPPAAMCSSSGCGCRDDACSAKALTATFIQVYGQEYCQYMKDHEDSIITPSSPIASRTSSPASAASHHSVNSADSHLFNSPDQSSGASVDGSSVVSQETPSRRRVWSSIDTSNLVAVRAVESTRHLDYQPDLTPKMRAILVDWIIELSEHFNFGPSTLHLACTLVDQVLACGPLSFEDEGEEESRWDAEDGAESKTNCFLISRDRFQLLGATCTWLACKMEEQTPPQVSQIAYVSDNIYSVEQIKRMERRVCNALGFALARRTPYLYIHEFIRASTECVNPGCESPPVFHNMVLYLLELGRLPYIPVTKKPSLLAAAAVYLARVTLGIAGGAWTKTLEYYTGYGKEDLKEVVLSIHTYQSAAEDSSLKSVFSKYKAKKYRRVALKTVPREQDLGF